MGHKNCGSCKYHVEVWVTEYARGIIDGFRTCACAHNTKDHHQPVRHHYSCPQHCPDEGPEDCEMWEDWGDTGVEA
jgi:hypothetical protein